MLIILKAHPCLLLPAHLSRLFFLLLVFLLLLFLFLSPGLFPIFLRPIVLFPAFALLLTALPPSPSSTKVPRYLLTACVHIPILARNSKNFGAACGRSNDPSWLCSSRKRRAAIISSGVVIMFEQLWDLLLHRHDSAFFTPGIVYSFDFLGVPVSITHKLQGGGSQTIP